MAIKSFDNANLKTLRVDINKALEVVAKKHGIALTIGSISYSDEEFHTKLQAVITDKPTSGLSVKEIKARNAVKSYGSLYGVSENDLNKIFSFSDGNFYKFVGLVPSRPKYSVVGQSIKTGKTFKFREEVLTRLSKKPNVPGL